MMQTLMINQSKKISKKTSQNPRKILLKKVTLKKKQKKSSDEFSSDMDSSDSQCLTESNIPKFVSEPSDYIFEDVISVYPTEEEFSKPIQYIQKLYQQDYGKFGLVKIIPPSSWKPDYVFSKIPLNITTRIQILNKLAKGEPYDQKFDEYSYDEFKQFADEFQSKYKYQTKCPEDFNKLRQNEYEFWKIIENPHQYEEVEVEYGADLPSHKFGSAFPDPDNYQKGIAKHPFNLTNINKQQNSLFQFLQKKSELSGIFTPWIYLGMLYSCFCWHVEDLYMFALNYLHVGAPKTWYGIPASSKDLFEQVFKESKEEIFENKPDILYHLTLMLSPALAQKKGVKIYRTDQKPGEFILVFPNTYHAGFSNGFNCGEALNVITTDWFKHYRESLQDYAIKGYYKKASFSLEWLMIQIIESINSHNYDSQCLHEIKIEWEKIVQSELDMWRKVCTMFSSRITIVEFEHKQSKYDRFVCKICGNYTYLSYIYCKKCMAKGCCHHITVCGCTNNEMLLFVRFNEKELQDFAKQINIAISQIKKIKK